MGRYDVDFEVDFPAAIARDAPDAVAMAAMPNLPVLLRTHCIRVCMFSSVCQLTDDPISIASATRGAARALRGFQRLHTALVGRNPLPELNDTALSWMRDIADAHAATLGPLTEFGNRAGRIVSELERAEASLAAEIEEMISFVYREFHYAAVALSEAIDAAHEELIAQERDRAELARSDAQGAVDRIDAISRTVRLIALNAAVEAARAGDAGRGFSVIAQEIKTLSEATESASSDVRASIDGIMDGLQT
ncbi:MAG: methyl-accepting chemotaxis protein [Pseudomonadota bacterium]